MLRFLMAAVFTCLSLPVAAATFPLTGDVDGRVRDIDSIFGPAFTAAGNEVYHSDFGFRTNTILEFDLSFVPGGEMFSSILISATDIAAANTLYVYGYAGNGVLDVADASETTNLLGMFSVTAGNNGPLALSTVFANSLLLANAGYLGLNIGVSSPQSTFGLSDFTVEFNTVPVEVVPLPAAGMLLLSALGGFGLIASRKKAHRSATAG